MRRTLPSVLHGDSHYDRFAHRHGRRHRNPIEYEARRQVRVGRAGCERDGGWKHSYWVLSTQLEPPLAFLWDGCLTCNLKAQTQALWRLLHSSASFVQRNEPFSCPAGLPRESALGGGVERGAGAPPLRAQPLWRLDAGGVCGGDHPQQVSRVATVELLSCGRGWQQGSPQGSEWGGRTLGC